MKFSHPLRLVLAPLVCCLSIAAMDTSPAAPAKKSPPAQTTSAATAQAPAAAPESARKTSFLKRLNPFRKKNAAPPAPETQLPPKTSARPKTNNQTTRPATTTARPVPPKNQPSMATARTLPPAAAAAAPAPPVTTEKPKSGFFSRLRSKLDREPTPLAPIEKPERPADWQDRWVVTEESTAFYEFGPSQANGPDLRLPRGEVVKLAQGSKGWSRIELEGGRQGYIGTDQLRQAAASDFAEPAPAPATQFASAGSGATPLPWSPAPPMPDLPDLPMLPGSENSLLLLPPLEFEGTELKKSSLRLPAVSPPDFLPGDVVPANQLPTETPAASTDPESPTDPDAKADSTPSEKPALPEAAEASSDPKPEESNPGDADAEAAPEPAESPQSEPAKPEASAKTKAKATPAVKGA